MTWTYNGIPGKRSRLRDLGLWVDPPEYYSAGDFVTVNLTLPEVRRGGGCTQGDAAAWVAPRGPAPGGGGPPMRREGTQGDAAAWVAPAGPALGGGGLPIVLPTLCADRSNTSGEQAC